MIPADYKPTQEDFELALERAFNGEFMTETGLSQLVLDALVLIIKAFPNVPKELVMAARQAFDLTK